MRQCPQVKVPRGGPAKIITVRISVTQTISSYKLTTHTEPLHSFFSLFLKSHFGSIKTTTSKSRDRLTMAEENNAPRADTVVPEVKTLLDEVTGEQVSKSERMYLEIIYVSCPITNLKQSSAVRSNARRSARRQRRPPPHHPRQRLARRPQPKMKRVNYQQRSTSRSEVCASTICAPLRTPTHTLTSSTSRPTCANSSSSTILSSVVN